MRPLISVIVPVYNGQEYLDNCIKSIEAQTYGNLEVIIVNDGSTDQTGAVCDRLQKIYNNVRVLTLHDEGVSAARNAGMEASEGELVTFVDADDRLQPEMLRVLYDCMVKSGSDVAGCRFFSWRSEKEWQQACEEIPVNSRTEMHVADTRQQADTDTADVQTVVRAETYTPDRYLEEAVLCGNSRCWSKLYRKEVVDRVRFREKLTIGEDMLFLVGMLPYTNKIAETDYQGYGYFQNPAGTINRAFTPRYMDQVTCWQLAREEVLRMNPGLDARVTALLITGIMLTAGKLAMLPVSDRCRNREYIRSCHESLKEAVKVPGAYGGLPAGYRVKAGMFLLWPGLYLWLYHLQKAARGAKEDGQIR